MSDLHARAEHFIAVVESPARPNERGDVDILLQEAVNLIRSLNMSVRCGGTEMVNKVTETAPGRIWLQVSDDGMDCDESFPTAAEDITWSDDSVLACEVEYVRADLVTGRHVRVTKGLSQLSTVSEGGNSPFANFIRSSGPEKDAAMMQVINAACDRQNAYLNSRHERRK